MSLPGSFVGGVPCAEAVTAATAQRRARPRSQSISRRPSLSVSGDPNLPRNGVFSKESFRLGCSTVPSGVSLGVIEESRSVDVSLEPLDEFVVIQPVSDETETRSGPHPPASAAAAVACRTGIVTAVGSDVTGVDAGDKVLYPRDAGYERPARRDRGACAQAEDLIARIHD